MKFLHGFLSLIGFHDGKVKVRSKKKNTNPLIVHTTKLQFAISDITSHDTLHIWLP